MEVINCTQLYSRVARYELEDDNSTVTIDVNTDIFKPSVGDVISLSNTKGHYGATYKIINKEPDIVIASAGGLLVQIKGDTSFFSKDTQDLYMFLESKNSSKKCRT
tara:strand:- start:118 stop:435 length:318 start_codon:yes stop_codon:yes gene_type:complete